MQESNLVKHKGEGEKEGEGGEQKRAKLGEDGGDEEGEGGEQKRAKLGEDGGDEDDEEEFASGFYRFMLAERASGTTPRDFLQVRRKLKCVLTNR